MDLDWTELILIIFIIVVSGLAFLAILGLRYVKKFVRWLTRPLTTSRPNRR